MKNAVTRGCAWVLIGLATLGPVAHAQTTEIYAGGANYVDLPGASAIASIGTMATGPDGALYFINSGGHIARFNSTNGTVTALPALPGVENPTFQYARGMAFDAAGVLHVSTDTTLYRVDLVAGTSTALGSLVEPGPMAFDSIGNLYYVSNMDHVIRVRRPNGSVEVFAGTIGTPGFSGDGGPATEAQLESPWNLTVAPNDDVYIADISNYRVRVVAAATGIISTVAGTGVYGYNGEGLPASQTQIPGPEALAFDAAGNLYISTGGNRILRLDAASGTIRTYVGTGIMGFSGDGGPAAAARISYAFQLALDGAGNLFFTDGEARRVRMVAADSGIISTAFGNGTSSFCGENVSATYACISEVTGLNVDDGDNLILSDWANARVRLVSSATHEIRTVALAQQGHEPHGVAHDATGNLYYASYGGTIWKVDAQTAAVTRIAGVGGYGLSGDGGPALQATFSAPGDVAVDTAGNIYISDGSNHRIRRIDAATGIITTYAGRFNGNILGDGGLAVNATFRNTYTIKFDPAGNLVISDGQNCRLRRINSATQIITTIAGNGLCRNDNAGDGQLATAVGIWVYPAFAFDPMGNIFVAWNKRLRRIDRNTGVITTVATIQTAAGTTFPYEVQDMEFDSQGNLYVVAMHSGIVFRVSGLPVEFPDATPPVIESTVVGQSSGNWYTSDVQVTWSVDDPESTVSSTSGCDPSSISSDTPGVTLTCVASSEGGTANKSVVVRRDATPPALEFGAATPAPDANGWNNNEVAIPFTTSDATSGVASTSTPSPVVISQEGVGITRSVTVRDVAGNYASFDTAPVSIDRTAPSVTPQITGTLGNGGWYKSDVQLAWSINEFPASIRSSSGCDSRTITGDTAGVTFTCSVTSAGGTTSNSVTIKRDATPPVLTFGAFSPASNANGWNKTNVTVPFTRSDALSGIASTSATSPLVMSTEGAAVTGQVTVIDNAGNAQVFTTAARNIDKTAPVVAIVAPANGATYGYYQDVVANYSCTDVSLLSCTAPDANGEMVNTKTSGPRTFKVTGKDLVNFTTSFTSEFEVEQQFNFAGFLPPMTGLPSPNLVARGSLVPIRWRLPDGHGGFVSNTASFSSATVQSSACAGTVVPLNDMASGPAGISYDASTGIFTYNWQTNASWTGCRRLVIKLKDTTLHELMFKFQ
jgi:sugar lactone lactonase YvrE